MPGCMMYSTAMSSDVHTPVANRRNLSPLRIRLSSCAMVPSIVVAGRFLRLRLIGIKTQDKCLRFIYGWINEFKN